MGRILGRAMGAIAPTVKFILLTEIRRGEWSKIFDFPYKHLLEYNDFKIIYVMITAVCQIERLKFTFFYSN